MVHSLFTFSLGYGWASLLIALPAAGFLVRLSTIQHPAAMAFFANREANDSIGRVIGTLTLRLMIFGVAAMPSTRPQPAL